MGQGRRIDALTEVLEDQWSGWPLHLRSQIHAALKEASHRGAGGEVYRRSLRVHSHRSRDRLRDAVGQQDQKSGQKAERN